MAIARAHRLRSRRCWSATSRPATSTARPRDEILELLQMLNREHGKTIVMVTHDPKAAEYAQPSAASRQGHARDGIARAVTSPLVKYLPLLWAGLFRKKTRTILTLLSVVVAFLLLRPAAGGAVAFESGADTADAKRLLTTARYSIIEPLPMRVPAAASSRCRAWWAWPTPTGSAPSTRTRATRFPCSRSTRSAISACTRSSPSRPTHREALRQDAHRGGGRQAPGRAVRLEGRAEAADQLGDPRQARTAT